MTTALPAPINALTGLTLTDDERNEVARLAEALAQVPPRLVDERAWIDAARQLACRLPVRIQQEVRNYRHDPGPDGLLILRNLPVEDALLPETPTVPESVERHSTVPAAVTALISLSLGEVIAYREEKSGALVQNVVPVPGREESQSNAGSTLLELHVENAFHPHRPDYVGLLCLRNDHTGTAGTLVSSIRRALLLIPDSVTDVLMAPRFVTEPPPSFHAGDSTPPHAVLEGHRDDPNIRVDFSATTALDQEGKAALELLREALLDVGAMLVLQPGELAFVDNRLSVHGRTSFEPRYDGHDRWLHRTFVHLDNRRRGGHATGTTGVAAPAVTPINRPREAMHIILAQFAFPDGSPSAEHLRNGLCHAPGQPTGVEHVFVDRHEHTADVVLFVSLRSLDEAEAAARSLCTGYLRSTGPAPVGWLAHLSAGVVPGTEHILLGEAHQRP